MSGITLKDVVEQIAKEFGKTLKDVKDVKLDNAFAPTKITVYFTDNTEMTIDCDYSKVNKQ